MDIMSDRKEWKKKTRMEGLGNDNDDDKKYVAVTKKIVRCLCNYLRNNTLF
jgi:hypothetical protein